MTRLTRVIPWAACALACSTLLSGCADSLPTGAGTRALARPVIAPVTLVVSDTSAAPGARVSVTVRVVTIDGALHAVEGGLAYDPAALRYVGQSGPDEYPVVVNPDALGKGEIRFLAFAPTGLPAEFVNLAFEVKRADYLRGLEYRHRHAVRGRHSREPVELRGRAALIEAESRVVTSAARIMSLADWSAKLVDARDAGAQSTSDEAHLVAEFTPRYGDVTRDGRIDLLDYLSVAFAAVGLDELILGTAADDIDLVTAGNVAPAIAGLACGVEASGHRELSLFDYLAIAFEATGVDEPCVGDVIPGRVQTALPRVTVRASHLLVKRGATRRFSADTIYRFEGVLRVEDGGTAIVASGARLEFAEGPVHGFRASSGLFVKTGGTIVARGSVAAPIVLTCVGADLRPGCWGGVDIEGSGSASVASALEFVRVEYPGGHRTAGSSDAVGLRLIDVGARATVRRVQVHGAAGAGLVVRGGDVGVREVLLTGNGGAAMHLSGNQRGAHERIIVQSARHASSVLGGIVIDTDVPATSSTSVLRLERLTLVGDLAPRATPAMLVSGRAPVEISGVIVAGYASGVHWPGAAVCAAATTSCVSMQGVHAEVAAAHWMRGAFDTQLPDWRPAVGAPVEAGRGATDAAVDGVIPWFAGWTRGFRSGELP